jgi:sugar phosphate isomerase/epimerase
VTDAGMVFGYHNHSSEFKKFDGTTAFDYLFATTDPKHVKIELDIGWVAVAGEDPVALLNQYKDRVVALHVKDVAKRGADGKEPSSVALGEGTVDWKTVLRAAKANGVKHYFYEQEPPFSRPILESAKISADYLTKLAV